LPLPPRCRPGCSGAGRGHLCSKPGTGPGRARLPAAGGCGSPGLLGIPLHPAGGKPRTHRRGRGAGRCGIPVQRQVGWRLSRGVEATQPGFRVSVPNSAVRGLHMTLQQRMRVGVRVPQHIALAVSACHCTGCECVSLLTLLARLSCCRPCANPLGRCASVYSPASPGDVVRQGLTVDQLVHTQTQVTTDAMVPAYGIGVVGCACA
jgi:hypothetical protein